MRELALLDGADTWTTRADPELGLRSLVFADGPHGLRKPRSGRDSGLGDSVPATCFPTATALASSWDPAMLESVGEALGREARALGVDVLLGPGLNLERSPLGGRNFEYLSEDPRLSGELAAALVRGIQRCGVGACIKHFVANNQEYHRMVVDARIDERTLRELYLRGFEIAVQRGQPAAVMAAYNRVNGTHATEHVRLLREILRGEWGFDGIVVSDWGAVDDRVAAAVAGLDLEMPCSHGTQLPLLAAALEDGRLEPEQVLACVSRLRALQERLGPGGHGPEVDLDEHHQLARRASAAGCVLLRNEDGVLPLRDGQRVALIGALAERPRYQGAGSSGVVPTRLVSLKDALGALATFTLGYRLDGEPDDALLADAVDQARAADVTIVVAGLPPAWESEGFDREHLRLPPVQEALIEAVAEASTRVAVVLCNGAALEMPWASRVCAVLEAWLGGQAVGEGVADVLLGVVNPSGKLAVTVAHRLEDHPSTDHFPGDGQSVSYVEGLRVGYRHFDTAGLDVLFPFGHGLSYTTFALSDLAIEPRGGDFAVSLTVRNTGERAGAEVVQVYAHAMGGAIARVDQELAGFARASLQPAEAQRIEILVERRALAFWDVEAGRWAVEAGRYELRVGVSSRDIRLRAEIAVSSADGPFAPRPFAAPPPAEPRPARPFTRQSTFGQVGETWLGRLLFRAARRIARRELQHGDDLELERFADAMVDGLPLRAMVTMSGRISWRQLNALLDLLNGRPLAAMRRLVGLA